MMDRKIRIGYHVNREKTLSEDLDAHSAKIRAIIPSAIPTMQIFAAGPKSSKKINVTDEEMKKIRAHTDVDDYILVIHGSYLDRPFDRSLPANHRPIADEVKMARKMGGIGPIIHLSKLSRRNGDAHIPQILRLVFEVDATRDVPNVTALIDEISSLHFPIVIDTAHIYASGIDIHDPVIMADLLSRLPKSVIGVHLNDTPSLCGSGIDRHAPIGNGEIFHSISGKKSLMTILSWAMKMNVWMILETPRGDDEHENELKIIADILLSQ
jgi:endonuclease IV